MPFEEYQYVRTLRELSGQDLDGDTQATIEAGSVGFIINAYPYKGPYVAYEVAFEDPGFPDGDVTLFATNDDLEPFQNPFKSAQNGSSGAEDTGAGEEAEASVSANGPLETAQKVAAATEPEIEEFGATPPDSSTHSA